MVAFENYRVAILRMLEHPPDGFEAFIPVMQQWTHQRATAIEARLAKAVETHPKPTKKECRVYSRFLTVVDYPRIQAEFTQIRAALAALYEPAPPPTSAVAAPLNEGSGAPDAAAPAEVVANGTPGTTASTPTVASEVEAAVQAFAHTSLAGGTPTSSPAPPAQTKSKRKRPTEKARACQYRVVEVPQPDGHTCMYQAIPSEYTYTPPAASAMPIHPPATKRTRWLWRRLDAKHPAIAPPMQPNTGSGGAVVL